MKSKSRYVRSNSESLGNHVVRSEKKKGYSGKATDRAEFAAVDHYFPSSTENIDFGPCLS